MKTKLKKPTEHNMKQTATSSKHCFSTQKHAAYGKALKIVLFKMLTGPAKIHCYKKKKEREKRSNG